MLLLPRRFTGTFDCRTRSCYAISSLYELLEGEQQPPLYTSQCDFAELVWYINTHLTMLRSNHILFTYHTSPEPKASWWGIFWRDSSCDYTPFDRVGSPLLIITTALYPYHWPTYILVGSQLETNRTAYTYISWLHIIFSSSSKQCDRREWPKKKEKFRTGM